MLSKYCKMIRVVTLFLSLLPLSLAVYQPGTPGIAWTEEQADIIKDKLLQLWRKPGRYKNDFDVANPDAKYASYVYDPTGTTYIPFYDECKKVEDCDHKICSLIAD